MAPSGEPFPGRFSPSTASVEFVVPDGHYFAMGDNRDNSSDSRVWGFVPDELLVGKAFVIWLNFSEPNRIGNWIN